MAVECAVFAVLSIPAFPLQAALRHRDDLRKKDAEVALVDDYTGKGTVLDITPAASRSGVAPGLPAVQALARCPGLVLLPRDPAAEATAQEILLSLAAGQSPDIEATAPGLCTLDLRTIRLPDPDAWGRGLVSTLGPLHLRARVGVGPNPDLAFLAARRAAPVLTVREPSAFLAGLPITALDPPAALASVLHDWGLRTLGDLTTLPAGDLADRLGPAAWELWQRASGRTTRLLRTVRPAEEFEESFAFEDGIETLEPLLFLLRRFLDQLGLRLRATHRVAAAMTLTLPLENAAPWQQEFPIPAPTTDADTLFRILHTRLETLQLEQRPCGIRLQLAASRPDSQQLQLFETPLRDPNRFGETLARLAALVGPENVGVPVPLDTHKPDAWELRTPEFHRLPRAIGPPPPVTTQGLPLRRFRPPVPAEVRTRQGRPVALASPTATGPITCAFGPWRLSGQWWETPWRREEWDVTLANGAVYRLSRNESGWTLEGLYEQLNKG